MTTADESLVLGGEFDDATRDQWRELVAGVLSTSGTDVDTADVEEALATRTDDGFAIRPLYTADDAPDAAAGVPGSPPFVRGPRAEGRVAEGWLVRQRQTFSADADPDHARDVIIAELEGGVSSLWLALGDGGGPPVETLATLLDGVFVDLAPIALDAGRDTPDAARALLRIAEERGAGPIGGSLGFDPLLARTRGGPALDDAYRDAMIELSSTAADGHPDLRTVVADGLPFHEAGASDGQELGATLAAGIAAVRTLVEAGLDVDDAFARVEFRLAATDDQFTTIAKLRAARRCWDRVGEVAGASDRPRDGADRPARAMVQHVVTSPAMMTARDPWVNMLRTTVACVAAGLGGADAVTVLPFDAVLGMPDSFARRVARNTQALLLEESHLAHVIDPAGGSWYVERLADDLAHAAWEVFTAIERDGGIETVLDDGSLAARFEDTWTARRDRIAHRTDPITGVSEFPNLHEERPGRTPFPTGTADREGGLPRRRYAQVFEQLRDRADAADPRPTVFLATVGDLAQYTARATFTTNLFHAGGIDTVDGPGGTDPAAIADAFREAGTTVAVLTSSDKNYGEHAVVVADALREAGATRLLLAGKDAGDAEVDDVLYAGSDAATLLTDTLDHLGAPA